MNKPGFLMRTAYLLNTILLYPFVITHTIWVCSTIALLGLFNLQNAAHRVAIFWGKVFGVVARMGITEVGAENQLTGQPVIIMLNHQSLMDIILTFSAIKIPFRYMVKASLFKIPIFGAGLRGCGYIPVNRDNRRLAMQSLFDAAKKVADGTSILIFPEGTRTEDETGAMVPFKKGAFVLAKKALVPIQPITIWGTKNAISANPNYWFQRLYPSQAKIIYHPPIMPEDYKDLKVDEITDMVYKVISAPIDELRKEIPMLIRHG